MGLGWPLLRLSAENDDALKEAYRQVYIAEYVLQEHFDWLGNRVRFHAPTFDHAFSESSNYLNGLGTHDIPFSKRRARQILWIKEVLKGTVKIERRHQVRKDTRQRDVKRRSLIVVDERYVVVLQETKNMGELEFVTAFSADEKYLVKLRGMSALIETRMPQSFGD